MPPVLLDTNILVYANDMNNPQKQERAQQIIGRLCADGYGYLGIQSLSEFSNVAIRKPHLGLSIEDVSMQVSWYTRLLRLLDLTPLIVLEAVRGVKEHGLAYYDAKIWACAKLNQVPVIFSEDFQDGQMLEGVRFVNLFAENFELEKWI
jgi:predicted nucleic acid-binding protein